MITQVTTPTHFNLNGHTVVVTRPAQQADNLCKMVEVAGGSVLRLPLIEIENPLDISKTKSQLMALAQSDIGIFVSANAVHKTLELLAPLRISDNIKLVAIGQSTGSTLKKHGYIAEISSNPQNTSEDLLTQQIFEDVTNKRITILRGNGGRDLIARALEERGASVNYIEVYRRIKPDIDIELLFDTLADNKIPLLSITSNESLKNLLGAIDKERKPRLLQLPLAVLSERTKLFALELGFKNTISVAKYTNDEGIMQALQDCIT